MTKTLPDELRSNSHVDWWVRHRVLSLLETNPRHTGLRHLETALSLISTGSLPTKDPVKEIERILNEPIGLNARKDNPPYLLEGISQSLIPRSLASRLPAEKEVAKDSIARSIAKVLLSCHEDTVRAQRQSSDEAFIENALPKRPMINYLVISLALQDVRFQLSDLSKSEPSLYQDVYFSSHNGTELENVVGSLITQRIAGLAVFASRLDTHNKLLLTALRNPSIGNLGNFAASAWTQTIMDASGLADHRHGYWAEEGIVGISDLQTKAAAGELDQARGTSFGHYFG